MAKTRDLIVEILKQIRDAVTDTNARLDQTNARLDQTNTNVAALAQQQVATEIRLATEMAEVTHAVQRVGDLLRERLDDRDRVDDHERRIVALERKPRRVK